MIVNGTLIKEVLLDELRVLAQQQKKRVCFIQFGDDLASSKFVTMKMNVAAQLGITAESVSSEARSTAEALLVLQQEITKGYDGIVLQLPVPAGMDANVLINTIPVEMDIDILSDGAMTAFRQGRSQRLPPVAAAVETILIAHHISLADKRIVICGKGKLVGEPVAALFRRMDVDYIAIDIHTPAADQLTLLQQADIIISGTGAAHGLLPAMIKDGVVLIDAGTSEHPSNSSGQGSGKLAGDIDPACADKASLYTPVPGGVGPIAVACLFKNLFL